MDSIRCGYPYRYRRSSPHPISTRSPQPPWEEHQGDTSNTRFWISYFDAGEYLLGKNGNHLELGGDCLGVIRYFDGYVAGDHGHAVRIPNVVCMHEEDYGILWKHTEPGAAGSQVRCSRRLVVSYFSTIGNYDYGFYRYFQLDGSIQLKAKATGIVFVGGGIPGTADPNAHRRSRPASSRQCISTCSAHAWTSRSTARTTCCSRSTPCACRWGR